MAPLHVLWGHHTSLVVASHISCGRLTYVLETCHPCLVNAQDPTVPRCFSYAVQGNPGSSSNELVETDLRSARRRAHEYPLSMPESMSQFGWIYDFPTAGLRAPLYALRIRPHRLPPLYIDFLIRFWNLRHFFRIHRCIHLLFGCRKLRQFHRTHLYIHLLSR